MRAKRWSPTSLLPRAAALVLAGVALAGSALAATRTWKETPEDDRWGNPGNWVEGVAPGTGDRVVFGQSSITNIQELGRVGDSGFAFALPDEIHFLPSAPEYHLTYFGCRQSFEFQSFLVGVRIVAESPSPPLIVVPLGSAACSSGTPTIPIFIESHLEGIRFEGALSLRESKFVDVELHLRAAPSGSFDPNWLCLNDGESSGSIIARGTDIIWCEGSPPLSQVRLELENAFLGRVLGGIPGPMVFGSVVGSGLIWPSDGLHFGELGLDGALSATLESSSGWIEKAGPGTTVYTGNATYQGGTTISGGRLRLAGGGALPAAGEVTIVGGALELADGTSARQMVVEIGNSGALRFEDSATAEESELRSAGTIRFDGHSTAASASLVGKARSATTFAGSATAADASILLEPRPEPDPCPPPPTPCGPALPPPPAGVLRFEGEATAGAAIIEAGKQSRVELSGQAQGGTARVTLSEDAVLDLSGLTVPALALGRLEGDGHVVLGQGTLALGSLGGDSLFTGVISGAGALVKEGDGELMLEGVNTYDGGTRIERGSLRLQAPGRLSESGHLHVEAAGAFRLSGLRRTIGGLSGTGTVALGGPTGHLTVAPEADSHFGGSITGEGQLTKAGAGTLTLTLPQSYLGGTTVSSGTLLVANTLGSGTGPGPVQVEGGGTLGGTGTIAGTVAVAAGGALSPGASPGALTLSGLLLEPSALLSFELGPPQPPGNPGVDSDLLVVGGDLILDGVLDIAALPGFGAAGRYRLIEYGGALEERSLEIGTVPPGVDPASLSIDSSTPGQVLLLFSESPSLSLSKTAFAVNGEAEPLSYGEVGDRVEYSITATNTGNVELTEVTIVDPQAEPLDCEPLQPAALGLGESMTCTGAYRVTEADLDQGSFTNVASAASDQTDEITAEATVFAARTTFDIPSATGTGMISGSISGGGASCTIREASAAAAEEVAGSGPPGVDLPHGLLLLRLDSCTPGSTVLFTVTFPSPLPPGSGYWKHGPTPWDSLPHWYELPATVLGPTVSFEITDGGLGDDTLEVNGAIEDPGGPGVAAAESSSVIEIPTLSTWALVLLALLLLAAARRLLPS